LDTAKLGIIGLGYIGKIHLRHGLKLKNAKIIAVSDISEKALAKAKKMGVKKTYNNYELLLKDPEINAVVIALPTHLHLQCAKKAAEAKKHIFLEKPMARTVEEAKEIISAAKKNSVKLMMGYPMRFSTEFEALRQKINDGTLGDIEVANAAYVSTGPFFHRADGYSPVPVPEWWFNKELTGGGVLIDLGSHIINLLRWFFGDVIDIKSHLRHRFNLDFEDSATCLAKFESGTTATINIGWFSQQYKLRIDLLGSVKHASVEHIPPNPIIAAFQMLTTGFSRFYQSHFRELEYFSDCVIYDRSPSSTAEDGLKDIEAISRAYKNPIFSQ
jgi:myo-inositol 2-dehydrogenase/D-chiro-inositol 1-dehydrogenase